MSENSIGEELGRFLQSGVGVMVGTRNADLVPEMTRGWGPGVANDGCIKVCISAAAGQRTLENLADNGRIALTFASPINYKQVQIKGRFVQAAGPAEGDLARVERHREEFARNCESIGTPRTFIEALFRRDVDDPPLLVRICFEPEQIFDQTPGPGAGSRL